MDSGPDRAGRQASIRGQSGMTKRTAAERLDPPKYKVTKYYSLHGIPYRPNDICNGGGCWPDLSKLDPINEGARRISRFYQRFQQTRYLPARPTQDGIDYFLPGGLLEGKQYASGIPVDTPPSFEDVENAPYYVANVDVAFADRTIPANTPFPWLRWPARGFRAQNLKAKQVIQYLTANVDHPDRPISPYDYYSADIRLPRLSNRATPQAPKPSILTDAGMYDEATGTYA